MLAQQQKFVGNSIIVAARKFCRSEARDGQGDSESTAYCMVSYIPAHWNSERPVAEPRASEYMLFSVSGSSRDYKHCI